MSANAMISDVYQDRITCFIDILGFSRDVASLDAKPALLLSVDAVLRRIGRCKSDTDRARATRGTTYDARMSCFSDCLVVSYRCEPGATLRVGGCGVPGPGDYSTRIPSARRHDRRETVPRRCRRLWWRSC